MSRFGVAARIVVTLVVAGFFLSFAYNYWNTDSVAKKGFAICLVVFGVGTLARDLRSWQAQRH